MPLIFPADKTTGNIYATIPKWQISASVLIQDTFTQPENNVSLPSFA